MVFTASYKVNKYFLEEKEKEHLYCPVVCGDVATVREWLPVKSGAWLERSFIPAVSITDNIHLEVNPSGTRSLILILYSFNWIVKAYSKYYVCHCLWSLYMNRSFQNSWKHFCSISSKLYTVMTTIFISTISPQCNTKSLLFSSIGLPVSLILATKDETRLWNICYTKQVWSWWCIFSLAWSFSKLPSNSSAMRTSSGPPFSDLLNADWFSIKPVASLNPFNGAFFCLYPWSMAIADSIFLLLYMTNLPHWNSTVILWCCGKSADKLRTW